MKFKPTKLKVIFSIIIGLIEVVGMFLISCIPSCESLKDLDVLINYFFGFIIVGSIVYIIWSLFQKNSRSKK